MTPGTRLLGAAPTLIWLIALGLAVGILIALS
jgi:hypothetical protein